MASKVFIKNIKSLYQVDDGERKKVMGHDMSQLSNIDDAFLAIEDGIIVAFGKMNDWPGIEDWSDLEVIDASDKIVMPTWCDSHTHLVFAGTREDEFVDRINGLSYEEIAARGGGILNSAKKLGACSEEELLASALKRIEEIKSMGTGAVEIKSGYGLSVESELKILHVIRELKKHTDLSIKSTFLGAHAYPTDYKENKSAYLDLVVNEMLPAIAEEGLADYIDAFCETNYFSVEDTIKVIEAGAKYGMEAKIHVNQFTSIGGIEACVSRNARSVDHLEVMTEEDIAIMAKGNTMPVLLPSCSFYLSIPYGPAKELMAENLPLCLATDYNPGSTPSGNIPFVIALACIKMKMTPEQAINAVTLNGAYAMGLEDSHGSIAVGKKGSVIIFKEGVDINYIPYSFGANHIDRVII